MKHSGSVAVVVGDNGVTRLWCGELETEVWAQGVEPLVWAEDSGALTVRQGHEQIWQPGIMIERVWA